MRKEQVVASILSAGSCDKLAVLDIAQPSRHLFHLCSTTTCSLRNHGDDRNNELEQQHQEPAEDEE